MRLTTRCVRRALCGAIILATSPLSNPAIGQADPASIDGWARETIELPPGFAPEMPSGVEELRFPPGWRDPESDNFWSYAIVMRIDEPAPSTARLEALTDIYYTGLMGAFGVGQREGSPPNDVDVELELVGEGEHRGAMRLVDGFATFEPVAINLAIRSLDSSEGGSILELRASPQPRDHEIWSDLQAAITHMHAAQADQRSAMLAGVAHLAEGEWRTTPANGRQQRDRWEWGPGRHALTSVTTNSEGTGEAIFGSFRILYHHPQRDEMHVLVLDAPALIQTGIVTRLDGLDLQFDMTLFYDQRILTWASEPTRRISSVWSFDGETRYVNRWIEDQGQPVDPSMTGWRYSSHDDLSPVPRSAKEPPEAVKHLGHFVPFLDSEWETDTTRTTFSWIPYNEAIRMRTVGADDGELMAETIVYPHPHSGTIHALTIHESGAIDEGTVEAIGPGEVEFTLARATLERTRGVIRRLSITPDGALREYEINADDPDAAGKVNEVTRTPVGMD